MPVSPNPNGRSMLKKTGIQGDMGEMFNRSKGGVYDEGLVRFLCDIKGGSNLGEWPIVSTKCVEDLSPANYEKTSRILRS